MDGLIVSSDRKVEEISYRWGEDCRSSKVKDKSLFKEIDQIESGERMVCIIWEERIVV